MTSSDNVHVTFKKYEIRKTFERFYNNGSQFANRWSHIWSIYELVDTQVFIKLARNLIKSKSRHPKANSKTLFGFHSFVWVGNFWTDNGLWRTHINLARKWFFHVPVTLKREKKNQIFDQFQYFQFSQCLWAEK